MARLIGIDIRASHVRAALLHTSYRKIALEQLKITDPQSYRFDRAGNLHAAAFDFGMDLVAAGKTRGVTFSSAPSVSATSCRAATRPGSRSRTTSARWGTAFRRFAIR